MTALLTWLSRLFWRPIPGRWSRKEVRRLAIHMTNAQPRSALE